MYPWRRVLIPTDFSTAARWAFDNAIHVAGTTAAELVILHIRMTLASRPSELRFPADDTLYEQAEQYELDALRERARHLNESVATRLLVRQAPDPGHDICRAANDETADLIVIATHARHHVAHLIIGSTTLAVISEPPAPVLAIRYGTTRRRQMRRLLVPIHPKQTATAASDLARAIAAHQSGEVHLVGVCEHAGRDTLQAHVAAAAARLGDVRNVTVILEGNDVEREILRYARRSDADTILLNSSIGDVKRAIIRSAETPVLIVPAP
jgi:nucleotide-binding universal stress UspA family protein